MFQCLFLLNVMIAALVGVYVWRWHAKHVVSKLSLEDKLNYLSETIYGMAAVIAALAITILMLIRQGS